MSVSDLDYLRQRAAEELTLAEECDDPRTAAIHRRMASLYADRVAALSEHPDFDPIVQTRLSV